MPAMANITVKKADETTNIVYDALTPGGGDGIKALWRQDTGAVAGLPVGHRAEMTMKCVWNGPRTGRRALIEFKRPYSTQDSTTTRYVTTDSVVMKIDVLVPQAIPASEIAEAVHQGLNLLASSLVKDAVKAGFPPT